MGYGFEDSDRWIERRHRRSIPWIFENLGEPVFRDWESEELRRLSSSRKPLVVATGGGAVLAFRNRQRMRRTGRTVFLDAPLTLLESRIAASDRPLLKGHSLRRRLRDLYRQRVQYYREADLRVFGRGTVEDVTASIVKKVLGTSRKHAD
jgi:shikimate kinase